MSTANERAGILSDLLLVDGDVSEANEPDTSGKSAIYYIIHEGLVELTCSGSLYSMGFLKGRENCFCSFFLPKPSNCFPVKTCFRKVLLFLSFFCNEWASSFRRHMVALLCHDQLKLQKN